MIMLSSYLFYLSLAAPRDLWDLFPDQGLFIESAESQPLDHQGIPFAFKIRAKNILLVEVSLKNPLFLHLRFFSP